jgi:hypothetical protein
LAAGLALADDDPEIEYLLETVAQSEHSFLRNGEAHDGPEAAGHLRKKYEYRSDDIDGAEAFIEQAASGSWLSGEPYRVQMADGSTELTRDWLSARLAEYRQRRQSADAR